MAPTLLARPPIVMISEAIEQLKRSFTDKFVTVLPQQPDLARFAGLTGQIKTVNMSGRALVEFADYHQNMGWYDIDLDHLVVVPAPNLAVAAPVAKAAPPAPAKAPAAKPAPAAEVKSPPAEKPAPVATPPVAKPPVAAKPSGAKQSVAEILAAARATDGGAAATAPAPKAAPKPAASGTRLSVAEMMAAARANDGAPAAKAPAAKAEVEEVAKPQVAGDSARTSRANLTAADIFAMATSSKRIEKLHAERRPMRVATSAPSRSAGSKRPTSEEATPPMTAAEILALQGKMKVKVQPVVSEPLPKADAAEAKPAASGSPAKPAPAAKQAPTAKPPAAAKPVAAAPVASSGGRPSIAEMLELCRSNAPFGTSLGAAPATGSEPATEPTPEPVVVAEAPAPPATTSNGSAGGRLSVAEAIAACRASDGG